jgi:hypothetical protein
VSVGGARSYAAIGVVTKVCSVMTVGVSACCCCCNEGVTAVELGKETFNIHRAHLLRKETIAG